MNSKSTHESAFYLICDLKKWYRIRCCLRIPTLVSRHCELYHKEENKLFAAPGSQKRSFRARMGLIQRYKNKRSGQGSGPKRRENKSMGWNMCLPLHGDPRDYINSFLQESHRSDSE